MSEPMLGEIKAVGFPWCPYGFAFANGNLLQIQQNNALYALYGVYFGGNGSSTFGLPNLQSRVGVAITTLNNHPFVQYQIGQVAGAQATTLSVGQMPVHNHSAATTGTATTTVTPTTTVTNSIAGLSASTTINALTGVPPASRVQSPAGNLLTQPQVTGAGTSVNAYAAPGAGSAATLATGSGGAATTTLSGSVTASATTTATAQTSLVGLSTVIGNNGGTNPIDIRPPLLALNYIVATLGVFPQRN